jgi:DNA-binding response OmpR family regulator
MRVLVVEDHELLAETIRTGLRHEGMAVDVVTDGSEALERLELTPYDVLVLDRDLPTISGDDVCRHVGRRGLPARILMLTAAGALADRVYGLDLGADDYLTKPLTSRSWWRGSGRWGAGPARRYRRCCAAPTWS